MCFAIDASLLDKMMTSVQMRRDRLLVRAEALVFGAGLLSPGIGSCLPVSTCDIIEVERQVAAERRKHALSLPLGRGTHFCCSLF